MAGIPMCLSTFGKPNLDYSVLSSKLVVKPIISASEWVIDIGATDHMVTITQFFTNMQIVYNVSVNGQSVMVTHIGSIQVNASLLLIDVLRVPSFDFNLILFSKLTLPANCCMFFLSKSLFHSRPSTMEDDCFG
jgi:hypothetical protein